MNKDTFKYWAVLAGLILAFAVSIHRGLQFLAIALFVAIIIWAYKKKLTLEIARTVLNWFEEIKVSKNSLSLYTRDAAPEPEGVIEKAAPEPLQPGQTREEHEADEEPTHDALAIVRYNRAAKQLLIGENQTAIYNLNEAISLSPRFSDAYLNLGVAHLNMWHKTQDENYLKESIDASRKALEIDPNGYRSRVNLAVALSKSREGEQEALNLFMEADDKGSYKDALTWGKVKLFAANLISTLSSRANPIVA